MKKQMNKTKMRLQVQVRAIQVVKVQMGYKPIYIMLFAQSYRIHHPVNLHSFG